MGGREQCFRNSVGDLNNTNIKRNKTSSFKIYKLCGDEKWAWDDDCENARDNTRDNSEQINTRGKICNNSNLEADQKCRVWCEHNSSRCYSSLQNYCNNENNVSSEVCKIWCRQNKGKCDDSAEKYCKNHLDNNDFCACYDANAREALPVKVRSIPEIAKMRR